jgi:nitrite reductase (NADH) small subunit
MREEHSMKHLVGYVSDFTDNGCKVVNIGRRRILIWRDNTDFYATREECPHKGAPLDCVKLTGTMLPSDPNAYQYGLKGTIIRCPWHKWEFDVRTGEPVFDTDSRKLVTYPVIVEDNQVYVELKA